MNLSGTPQNISNQSLHEIFPSPSSRHDPSMEEEPEYFNDDNNREAEIAQNNILDVQKHPKLKADHSAAEHKNDESKEEVKIGEPVPNDSFGACSNQREEEKVDDDQLNQSSDSEVIRPVNYPTSYHSMLNNVYNLRIIVDGTITDEKERNDLLESLNMIENQIREAQTKEEISYKTLLLKYQLTDVTSKLKRKIKEISELVNDRKHAQDELEEVEKLIEAKQKEINNEKGDLQAIKELMNKKGRFEAECQEKKDINNKLAKEIGNIKAQITQFEQNEKVMANEIDRLTKDTAKLNEELPELHSEEQDLKEEYFVSIRNVEELEMKTDKLNEIKLQYEQVLDELDAFIENSNQQEEKIKELNKINIQNNLKYNRSLREKMEDMMSLDEKIQELHDKQTRRMERINRRKHEILKYETERDALALNFMKQNALVEGWDLRDEESDVLKQTRSSLADKKEKHDKWNKELRRIDELRQTISKTKQETLKMIEESKIGEEEYKKLELECSHKQGSYKDSVATFQKQKQFDREKRRRINDKINEVEWMTKRETNYFSAFRSGFIPTVIALGIIWIYYYGATGVINAIRNNNNQT